MNIKHVTIHNWRSIKHVDVWFEKLMVFIGQNNHGKSNILSALLFFFGQLNHGDLDFNDGSDELFIEIIFHDLDESDKTTFKKYLSSDGTIKVRKTASKTSGSEYHGYIETPDEDWLKEDKISDYTKRDIAEGLPLSDYLPNSGRITKDIFQLAQTRYIEDNHSEISFSYELETNNLLGTKNVAKGIWGDVFFIPSVKKASDELTTKSNSVFSQLYGRVINAMSENSNEYSIAKTQLQTLVNKLNKHADDGSINTERPNELTDFESILEHELRDWDTKIDVEITPPDIDDILKVGTSVWVDDGIRTDIARKGQGLQRALIFALIMSLAKASKERNDSGDINRRASRSAYFIFEEPELFLHPQAQRALFESLELLSDVSQVILCTHSSSFINLDTYRSICRVIKNDISTGTQIYQCLNNLFGTLDDKKKFNLVYWVNPDRSELFFAKKVILLEGPTEKTVIPLLAKKLGVFKHDYTLIDCASKDCIPQYIELLQSFSIPYVAVYDKDHQAHKNSQQKQSADDSSGRIESLISSHLGESVVFENDIEEELGIAGGSTGSKPYAALQHIVSSAFGFNRQLKTKIETIYY